MTAIRFPVEQHHLLDLVNRSALSYCTDVRHAGHLVIVDPRRPVSSFSTGEKQLWALLVALVEGLPLPDLGHLDAPNTQVAQDAIRAARAVA